MVYKINDNVSEDPYTIWMGSPLNEDNTSLLNLTINTANYLNRIVPSCWNQSGFTINEAEVRLYSGGTLQKYLRYSASGTDKENWFSASRQTSASWTDILTEPQNIYSIVGESASPRRWFISRNYGGCPNDAGWLSVTLPSNGCDWDHIGDPPVNILYASPSAYQNWDSGSISTAEVLAVFVR